jgi:hypothetical protein
VRDVRDSRRRRPPLVPTLVLLGILVPTTARAQAGPQGPVEPRGVLPESVVHVEFRKYVPPSRPYSPFYSWDSRLGLDAMAFRTGDHGIDLAAIIQSVGTENVGSRIGIGAVRYMLGFGYVNASSPVTFSVGFRHLSSHLTRDLDEKEREVRSRGGVVSTNEDSLDSNIVYVKGVGTLSTVPFTPEIVVLVAPVNFRLGGGELGHVRPFYAETRWRLWESRAAALLLESRHELGGNPFNEFTLRIDLARQGESIGRFQILLSAAPGQSFHVSPHMGGVADGVTLGVRLRLPS